MTHSDTKTVAHHKITYVFLAHGLAKSGINFVPHIRQVFFDNVGTYVEGYNGHVAFDFVCDVVELKAAKTLPALGQSPKVNLPDGELVAVSSRTLSARILAEGMTAQGFTCFVMEVDLKDAKDLAALHVEASKVFAESDYSISPPALPTIFTIMDSGETVHDRYIFQHDREEQAAPDEHTDAPQ